MAVLAHWSIAASASNLIVSTDAPRRERRRNRLAGFVPGLRSGFCAIVGCVVYPAALRAHGVECGTTARRGGRARRRKEGPYGSQSQVDEEGPQRQDHCRLQSGPAVVSPEHQTCRPRHQLGPEKLLCSGERAALVPSHGVGKPRDRRICHGRRRLSAIANLLKERNWRRVELIVRQNQARRTSSR